MRVGFFQYAVKWGDRDANLVYIREKLSGSIFDLLVLPELFTSGYAFDSVNELIPLGENLATSPTIDYLMELTTTHGGYISGSIPELSDGRLYNTSILVGPNGLAAFYRKIHLPDYEKRTFTSGERAVVCSCGDAMVGLTICFDIWFAPLSSKLKLLGADIICHSACFGGPVTPTIIPIRAIENQCFVISCNRIGIELFRGEPDSYRGESQIISPDGKILAKAGGEESLTIIDIDLDEVNRPAFGSMIEKDFIAEHAKYNIEII